MDVGVGLTIMGFVILVTLGIIMPLAARNGRKRIVAMLPTLVPEHASGELSTIESPLGRGRLPALDFPWRGARAFVGGYYGRYPRIYVGLHHSPLPRIYVRPETARDRRGKRLGLNREIQTGDADFDAALYVESDESDAVVEKVLGRPEMRAALRRAIGPSIGGVRFGPDGIVAIPRIGRLEVTPTLDVLEPVRAAAPEVDASELRPRGPARGDWLAATMLWAFIAILVMFSWVPWGYADYRGVLDDSSVGKAFLIAFAAWIVVVPFAWVRVRGHSRSYRNFLMTVVFGFPTLLYYGPELLYLANATFDHSVATPRDVEVADRYLSSGRSRDHARLTLRPWSASHGVNEIEVSRTTYNEFHPGDTMRIAVRRGAFGWAWAESITLLAPAPSLHIEASVTSAEGLPSITAGTRCSGTVWRRPRLHGPYHCQIRIECSGRSVYGSDTSGYVPCTFAQSDAHEIVAHDAVTTPGDRDAAMDVDTHAGVLRAWDDATRNHGAYRVEARIENVR